MKHYAPLLQLMYLHEVSRLAIEIIKQGSNGKLKVTILAAKWGFSLADSSLLSTHLAVELARFPDCKVTVLVPVDSCSEWQKRKALSNGVEALLKQGNSQVLMTLLIG